LGGTDLDPPSPICATYSMPSILAMVTSMAVTMCPSPSSTAHLRTAKVFTCSASHAIILTSQLLGQQPHLLCSHPPSIIAFLGHPHFTFTLSTHSTSMFVRAATTTVHFCQQLSSMQVNCICHTLQARAHCFPGIFTHCRQGITHRHPFPFAIGSTPHLVPHNSPKLAFGHEANFPQFPFSTTISRAHSNISPPRQTLPIGFGPPSPKRGHSTFGGTISNNTRGFPYGPQGPPHTHSRGIQYQFPWASSFGRPKQFLQFHFHFKFGPTTIQGWGFGSFPVFPTTQFPRASFPFYKAHFTFPLTEHNSFFWGHFAQHPIRFGP